MRVGIEKMDTLPLIVRKSSLDHLFVVSFLIGGFILHV